MEYQPILRRRRLFIATMRQGVTLLEVLMAMGVMVVGLMGLASLIPLGRLEMAEGDKLDNSATLGRSAFREVTVRNYLRPEMWADPITGRNVIDSANSHKFAVSLGSATLPPNGPIVIDPLMLAPEYFGEAPNQATLENSREAPHRRNCQVFPYSFMLPGQATGGPESSSNKPMIARVSLRSHPSNIVQPGGASPAQTMRYDVASRYFRANDDLVFTVPKDQYENPIQVFTPSALSTLTLTAQITAANAITRANEAIPTRQAGFRQFRGDYSWFLIAQPSLAETWSTEQAMPVFGGPDASPSMMRQFRTWVVVCHQRDLRNTATMNLSNDPVVGERAVWVDFVDRMTARLRVHGIQSPQTAAAVLDVKTNQWVCAIGRCQAPMLGVAGYEPVQYGMEWYRVLNVAAEPRTLGDETTWYREVTLAGRDFTDPTATPSGLAYDDANATSYPDAGNPPTGWGVIVRGVRGVYEKSVFVDRPSLWAPLD